ncbi:MAG TPA: dihydroxyacetone kinase subunit DhaL [Actinomycetales bacterium]
MADGITAADLGDWLRAFAAAVREHSAELTELDSAIGDADHGTNMERGLAAAVTAVEALDSPTPKALLQKVGTTMVSSVGGTSGPLYGTFFLRLANSVADADPVTPAQLAAAVRAGLEGVAARGKAEPGDKTMLDALGPAADALDAAVAGGGSLGEALAAASAAADGGRDATVPLQARKGRASYLGERSVGHQDPGATSLALMFAAAATTLA